MNVNRSSYYKHHTSEPAPRTLENQRIRSAILEIHTKYNKRLGAAKINVVLSRDYGINISLGRVYRLMKNMNLPKMSTAKPAFNKTKAPELILDNKLNKKFDVPSKNLVWCSDITYIKTGNSFSYLCVIMDLFSRKIIAYNVSSSMTSKLVIDTLDAAIRKRKPQNVILHSDRGVQYTSEAFRSFCDLYNVSQSFSAKGHPYDNAVVESFFKYLKKEELHRRHFRMLGEVKLAVFKYIDCFYNSIRPHSAIDMLTPLLKDSY